MNQKGPPEKPPEAEQLSPNELKEKFRDPSYLPTHKDVSQAFNSEDGFSAEWFHFCSDRENPIFEFLNEEFINAFSVYLSSRIESLGASENSPITILEVGAGNGRLSHFLRQKLEMLFPGKIKVIATDSGEWELKTSFPVETIGHKEALQKYQPQIVIFSWMPYEEDYTKDFRTTQSVDEYILIGETDGGCCGHNWETWGYAWSFDEEKEEEKIAPYVADGFERKNIDDVSVHQICRTDQPENYYHSSTTSFRRKK